jgi:outer membrane protein assembly factor BamB
MKQALFPVLLLLLSWPFPASGQSVPAATGNPDVRVIIGTFLGNDQRNYYGNEAPSTLNIIWKHYLGQGMTVISRKSGSRIWAGAGWTGQPLLVEENGELFLIQGAYDHHLKKIKAATGELVWQYQFDDVVKGTGTIWENNHAEQSDHRYVILQGSRLGTGNFLDTRHIPSYRAISYLTGRELWRFDVSWTDSYSRDVDASALIIRDTVYIGLENALFTVFDPDPAKAVLKDSMLQPKVIQQIRLYEKKDIVAHNYNLVTESSPSLLGEMIYLASGSGHIYGYSLVSRRLEWDFYTGSDMDGSAIITSDSCILASIEKQYIAGHGGALKLDPAREPADAVLWYFPTGDNDYGSWQGGIIGSIGISDSYNKVNNLNLAAFAAIDGYLYVVDHTLIDSTNTVTGMDGTTKYPCPKLIFKDYLGPSISTPIFTGNRLVVAGYGGITIYEYDNYLNFKLLDHFPGSFEATPVCHNGKIYIASRNGYLYCFGD